MRSVSAWLPQTMPPMASAWPPRNLVALCSTRSAPSASGFWFTGVAKVLSITTSAPAACPAAARRRMSCTFSSGLVGDSRYSSSQPPASAASKAVASVVSHSVTCTPHCGRVCCNR
ncbi:hypothetical protein D3C78_1455610 [compost metagenome]